MSDLLSPSPYAIFDGLPPAERLAAIRLREHRANINGGSAIETARRARDLQAELAEVHYLNLAPSQFDLHVMAERDAYRSMCAELVEELSRCIYAILIMRPDVLVVGGYAAQNVEKDASRTLARARMLLEGKE